MLIKDDSEYKRARDHLDAAMPSIGRVILARALTEYESANPPKTVAVNCSVCGSAAEMSGNIANCTNRACFVTGPYNDPDAAKWNKLHRRKLPLDRNKPYWVYKGGAQQIGDSPKADIVMVGDGIDLTDWF